jgi:radical SAM protein with 4Fe4S-binding SPASM domain
MTTAALSDDERRVARLIRSEDFERGTPIYCVWEITLKCDLGCRHCGSRAGKARPDELTTAQCVDVVRELHELGVREVTLIGGEAWLREDWDVIARAITDRGMNCSITTGARNLTPDRVARAVDAGVHAISISIDGLRATHDAQRGVDGSFDAAIDAARRVALTPIQLAFNTQINRLSMPELPAVADLLREVGARAWQLQITVPMGRAADRPELLLQPHDLLELFPLLLWLKKNKLDPNQIAMFPGNNIGYFSPYEGLLRYYGERGGHWTGCSAGKWTLGLEADGKIKGCPSLPSNGYTGGYLGRDRLADVVASAPELRHVQERTAEDLWGYCRSCYYASTCRGGCSWMATMLFKRTGNNPYCIHRALELESRGMRERVVRVERAPGQPFDGGRFEIVLETLPEPTGEGPTIAGLRPDQVLAISTDQPSIWDEATIRARLAQS